MKVLILAGGTSTERDVSFVTGKMVYKALVKRGHNVILTDVYYGLSDEIIKGDFKGAFELDTDWSKDIAQVSENAPKLKEIIANRPASSDGYFGLNILSLAKEADIVFLGLHGENGENGKIQAAFDLLGIKYTGTGYLSSALAMDKAFTKSVFVQNSVPTPEYFVINPGGSIRYPEEYPVVVKTACGGSSVGVYIANDKADYENAVKNAEEYGSEIIVEKYIKGREFSIGVVDGEAYPIIEIAPVSGFYDYKNKYQAGSTIETCPAQLSEEITKGMQQAACRAYEALSMESYARMDFMMNENGEYFCLEANTLPGMTPTSLLPQEAAARGESFEELCDKIIKVSLKKYEKSYTE